MPTDHELSRWQGQIDAQMSEVGRRLDSVSTDVAVAERSLGTMQTQLAELKVRVAFWSAVGGLIGAGVVSTIVAIATAGAG